MTHVANPNVSREAEPPAHLRELFADVANFLNLLDSGWNILKSRGGFNGLVSVADADVDDEGRYIIDDFNPDDQNFIAINPSAWRVQVGVRYEF